MCASSREWPARRALKEESTWKSSLAYRCLAYSAADLTVCLDTCLIPDYLCRGQWSNIPSIRIDIASVEQFGIRQSMLATCVDVWTNVV
jgi:hypothetical protein